MTSKLNIFTDAAIAIKDYGACVGYLDEISVQLNILIAGIRAFGRVQLSISVSVLGGIIFALIEVRHCFNFNYHYFMLNALLFRLSWTSYTF